MMSEIWPPENQTPRNKIYILKILEKDMRLRDIFFDEFPDFPDVDCFTLLDAMDFIKGELAAREIEKFR